MLDKLARLGATPTAIPEAQKAQQLARLEAATGPLPDYYRKLLLHFGGDIEFSTLVAFRPDVPSPWTSRDGTDSLEMLYGLTSKYHLTAREMFDTYRDRIRTGWIPIGAAPGGIKYASTLATPMSSLWVSGTMRARSVRICHPATTGSQRLLAPCKSLLTDSRLRSRQRMYRTM